MNTTKGDIMNIADLIDLIQVDEPKLLVGIMFAKFHKCYPGNVDLFIANTYFDFGDIESCFEILSREHHMELWKKRILSGGDLGNLNALPTEILLKIF